MSKDNGLYWKQKRAKRPYAFVQWNGTDVSADIYCLCGMSYRYDGGYFHKVTCGSCGKSWDVEPFLRLVPAAEDGVKAILLA